MIEIWKSIPSAPDYEASSLGRIRRIHFKNGNTSYRHIIPKVLRPAISGSGYLSVSISIQNLSKSKQVHALVAEAFFGPCPQKFNCAHLDGNKENNAASNLRWVSRKENEAHKKIHGTKIFGERVHLTRHSERVVLNIKNLFLSGMLVPAIARKVGLSYSYVYGICKKNNRSHETAREVLAREVDSEDPKPGQSVCIHGDPNPLTCKLCRGDSR